MYWRRRAFSVWYFNFSPESPPPWTPQSYATVQERLQKHFRPRPIFTITKCLSLTVEPVGLEKAPASENSFIRKHHHHYYYYYYSNSSRTSLRSIYSTFWTHYTTPHHTTLLQIMTFRTKSQIYDSFINICDRSRGSNTHAALPHVSLPCGGKFVLFYVSFATVDPKDGTRRGDT